MIPTTPGPYFWRENDGDEWEVVVVRKFFKDFLWGDRVKFPGRKIGVSDNIGQWKRIPTPDDGQEAWAVFVNGEIKCNSIDSDKEMVETQLDFYQNNNWSKECTVQPVTIYPKDE